MWTILGDIWLLLVFINLPPLQRLLIFFSDRLGAKLPPGQFYCPCIYVFIVARARGKSARTKCQWNVGVVFLQIFQWNSNGYIAITVNPNTNSHGPVLLYFVCCYIMMCSKWPFLIIQGSVSGNGTTINSLGALLYMLVQWNLSVTTTSILKFIMWFIQ